MLQRQIARRARIAGRQRKKSLDLALQRAAALRLAGLGGAKTDHGSAFRRAREIRIKTDDALDLGAGEIERGGGDTFRFGRQETEFSLRRAQGLDEAARAADPWLNDFVQLLIIESGAGHSACKYHRCPVAPSTIEFGSGSARGQLTSHARAMG